MRGILLVLPLTVCGPEFSNVCPSLKVYSTETQKRAGAELAELPPGSVLPGFMDDYGALREEVRACRGER